MPFGADDALLIATIGNTLGGLFGGGDDPQKSTSFIGTDADPTRRMSQLYHMLEGLGGSLAADAGGPISLPSAVVQTPGGYSGGGLPTPIGLSGLDPAIANPGLLSTPGLDLPDDLFQVPKVQARNRGQHVPNQTTDVDAPVRRRAPTGSVASRDDGVDALAALRMLRS